MTTHSSAQLIPVLTLLLATALAACGTHAATGAQAADASIEECDAFLATYEHCLGSLGPAWIAQARAEQARTALIAQAGNGEGARTALRQKCADNLSQLRTTCP